MELGAASPFLAPLSWMAFHWAAGPGAGTLELRNRGEYIVVCDY
jgi:hypothetical protein